MDAGFPLIAEIKLVYVKHVLLRNGRTAPGNVRGAESGSGTLTQRIIV
jgi:hypothetical protein